MAHDLNNKEPFDIKKKKNPKQQNQPKSKHLEDSEGEHHYSAEHWSRKKHVKKYKAYLNNADW